MRRQPVSFEWHVAEDETSWNVLALDAATGVEARRQRINVEHALVIHVLRWAAIVLAGIVLVAGVDLTPEERKRLRATVGIEAVLLAEAQMVGQIVAQEQNSSAAFTPLLDKQQARLHLAESEAGNASLDRENCLGQCHAH